MDSSSGGQAISSEMGIVCGTFRLPAAGSWAIEEYTPQGAGLRGDLTRGQQEEVSHRVSQVLNVLRGRWPNPSAQRTPFPPSREHTEELETNWEVCLPTAENSRGHGAGG